MELFLGICTVVGLCFVLSFMFKALGKLTCWVVGGVVAIAGALLMGSFALVFIWIATLVLFGMIALVA